MPAFYVNTCAHIFFQYRNKWLCQVSHRMASDFSASLNLHSVLFRYAWKQQESWEGWCKWRWLRAKDGFQDMECSRHSPWVSRVFVCRLTGCCVSVLVLCVCTGCCVSVLGVVCTGCLSVCTGCCVSVQGGVCLYWVVCVCTGCCLYWVLCVCTGCCLFALGVVCTGCSGCCVSVLGVVCLHWVLFVCTGCIGCCVSVLGVVCTGCCVSVLGVVCLCWVLCVLFVCTGCCVGCRFSMPWERTLGARRWTSRRRFTWPPERECLTCTSLVSGKQGLSFLQVVSCCFRHAKLRVFFQRKESRVWQMCCFSDPQGEKKNALIVEVKHPVSREDCALVKHD